jgi:hypothetical protein
MNSSSVGGAPGAPEFLAETDAVITALNEVLCVAGIVSYGCTRGARVVRVFGNSFSSTNTYHDASRHVGSTV